MTGVELNDFSGLMGGFVSADIKPSQKAGDFADILANAGDNKTTDPLADLQSRVESNAKEIDSEMNSNQSKDKVSEPDRKDSTPSKESAKAPNNTSNEKTEMNSEITDEEVETMSGNLPTMFAYFAQVLNVTPEEVSDAISEIDMSVNELLSESGINEIVMNVCNLESPMDIVTDEQLFDAVTKLDEYAQNVISTLSEELGISEDEVKDFLSEVKIQTENVEEPVPIDVVFEDTAAEDKELFEFETSFDNVNETAVENKAIKIAEPRESKSEHESDSDNENKGTQNSVTQMTNGNTEHTEAVADNKAVQYVPDAQEIFDQIGDYIKNLSTRETSEIEIGLHPEELGNLHIKVTNQDGVVTAKLIAENEAVKGVLESQLVTLKNQFEEQGIKVNSVEVSIESRSFDQGLNQNSESGSKNATGKKTSIRRINLSQIEDGEELDEEEQIAVEMMKADGNSVDYKA